MRRPLRILGYVKHSWPQQVGGSEVSLHRALAWFASRGHETRCIVTHQRGTTLDGVEYAKRGIAGIREWWEWADVAITHLGASAPAIRWSDETGGIPVAHWAHNWHWYDGHADVLRPDRDLIVWNSQAMAGVFAGRWAGPSIVVRPPVFAADWAAVQPGDRITQVNIGTAKGGALFWALARARPEQEFLAVVGGWGTQIAADGRTYDIHRAVYAMRRAAPSNVKVISPTRRFADVLAETRVLVIPTGQIADLQLGESYGLVAAEAACAGIPTIATRSPGTEEALGDAGIWADPEDPDDWLRQLDLLADPGRYRAASEASRARSALLDPTDDLEQFEQTLLDLRP